jgi:hypothetical protein
MTQNKINPDPEGYFTLIISLIYPLILFVLLDLMVISKE